MYETYKMSTNKEVLISLNLIECSFIIHFLLSFWRHKKLNVNMKEALRITKFKIF